MWLCWLIGHKFYYSWFAAEEIAPTNFCTRCGKRVEDIQKDELSTEKSQKN